MSEDSWFRKNSLLTVETSRYNVLALVGAGGCLKGEKSSPPRAYDNPQTDQRGAAQCEPFVPTKGSFLRSP